MGDQATMDTDAEMRPVTDATDGGKHAEDKKANLKSDAENTTPDVRAASGQNEINGEVRDTPRPRGRPRKIRTDENVDKNDFNATKTPRGRKRAYSETDDETKFRGFEIQMNIHPGLDIINKLLADVKNVSPLPSKRIRRPTVKVLENADTEASENRSRHVDPELSTNAHKQDTDHESDLDIGVATGSSDQETEQREESTTVVTNPTPGRRGRRPSNFTAASPRQGAKGDTYKKPFVELGWKRELVHRGSSDSPQADNLTHNKEAAGFKKSAEVVRESRSTTQIQHENSALIKSASPSSLEVDTASKNDTPVQKKVAAKRGRPRLNPKAEPITQSTADNDLARPSSPKTKFKDIQNDARISPKRGIMKKDQIKSSPMTRRSQQNQQPVTSQGTEADLMDSASEEIQQTAVSEKTIKTNKRIKRTNIQEPCSIRCSTSTGGIPSLQCTVCLCLYHAECVGCLEEEVGDNYICKNCKDDTEEVHQPSQSTLTPPPLIPISLLGPTAGAKYKSQGLISLPKLQRISRDENQGLQKLTKASTNLPKYNSNIKPNERKNDFFGNQDVTSSLPAQNLAVMNGKKYIVIPKDNAMAVQPNINTKRDKAREQPMTTTMNLNTRLLPREVRNPVPEMGVSSLNTEQMSRKLEEESKKLSNSDNKSNAVEGVEEINNSLVDNDKINIDNNNIRGKIEEEPARESLKVNEIEVDTDERKKASAPLVIDRHRYNIANACAYYDAFPRVFQYLKVQELLRASRVCKMWRDLAAHPSLWRTVRMKNSQVTDWDGFAEALNRYQTQHLDLRKILMPDGENIWAKFIEVLPKIKSLKKLELCRCPGSVVEAVIENCSQLETFSAMSIRCDVISLKLIKQLKNCTELRLKAITGMTLCEGRDPLPLGELKQLVHLSLTSVKELGRKDIYLIKDLVNLEVLELGECSDLPEKFGTDIIANLPKLERLRLEKGQGACYTFNILEGVSQSPNLTQLELVNFDIKKGFDSWLAKCKNIKRLLIIPTYISQSATSNHMILGGVTQLKETLTNFIWGVTLELLRVTDLFVDQCMELKKRIKGDAIPVLKPIPCAELIEDILKDAVKNAENTELAEMERRNSEDQTNAENLPEVDILTLLQLQKLLLLALPTTRVKILKIPFHATWRQSLLDSAMQ